MHRIIEFKPKSWLKSYTDMNTDLRQKTKTDFEKDLEKLWKCEKTQIYYIFHNRKKKKLFDVRSKLSYHTVFPRKFVGYRNEST